MYFVCKISDAVLLLYIKSTFVHAVSVYCITKLSTCHMMKYQTFFTGIYNFTIVESFKFFCKLCLFCKFYECIKHIIINSFCCIIVRKSLSHRNAVIFYTLCTVLA